MDLKNLNSQTSENTEVSFLLQAFSDFEKNAQKLEKAYNKMQEDFKNLNIELDKKNNLLSNILENLTNGVISIDDNGKIINFNRAAERITGYSEDKILGKDYDEILGKNIKYEMSLKNTLDTGKHINEGEKDIFNYKGEPVPVSFSTSIIEDNEGKKLGALEVIRDLSEVKKMQQEVQRNKTLAAMGEMSAAVAHEIRNPLGAIGGYITLLERDLENDPQKLEIIQKVIKSLSSLNKIVGNLLAYTRPMVINKKSVNISEHISQILDFIMIGIKNENIKIEKEFPKEPLFVDIDPEKTEQLMINIVQNAVNAINDDGLIRIKIWEKIELPEERIFLKGIRVYKILYVSVIDNGKGIKEKDIDKLFNPFFTTREDGTGLGLSIVKKIIDLHNGEISVNSKQGKGTVFTVAFPSK